MSVMEGGCLCGAQRYEALAGALRVTICHCKFCQRATGSGFMIEPIFDKAAIRSTRGEPKVYSQTSAGSGMAVHVHFCADCGTKLWLSFERFPSIVGLYAGTLDDPNWIEVTRKNSKQIFLDSARPDSVILAGMNAFGQHSLLNDGTLLDPTVIDHLVTVAEGWPVQEE